LYFVPPYPAFKSRRTIPVFVDQSVGDDRCALPQSLLRVVDTALGGVDVPTLFKKHCLYLLNNVSKETLYSIEKSLTSRTS